jgi:phage regulator Rha-like protein
MYRYVKAYSRTVGDEFGKEHWNVLVEIRTLDKKIEQFNERTGKLGQLKFEPTYIFQSTYTDRWNAESYPAQIWCSQVQLMDQDMN